METVTKAARSTRGNGQETGPSDTEPEHGQSIGQARRRPERVFRVGNCWGTVWCNEQKKKSGPNEQTTRIIRSVNLERRFWNEKLKDGKGDYDSTSSFGLGDVHNLIAVAALAADYLKQAEADVTRDA